MSAEETALPKLSSPALKPVLIVDDEVEITKSISRDLRNTAVVEAFTDPQQALKAFSTKDYSVVISDLQMPGLNGLQLLEQCAKIKPFVPRILLTAFSDLVALQDLINKAKISRLMTKPWEAHDLQVNVELALREYELATENVELRKLALSDPLTGIANRRYFFNRLESEFSRAKRFQRPLTIIMGDVDNFKVFNDSRGHVQGDEALKSIAAALESGLRSMDTVARYGGEEFVILLPEATRSQGVDIAKRHLENVQNRSPLHISLGVATFPDDAATATELVERADRALLKAKALGKSRVTSYTEV